MSQSPMGSYCVLLQAATAFPFASEVTLHLSQLRLSSCLCLAISQKVKVVRSKIGTEWEGRESPCDSHQDFYSTPQRFFNSLYFLQLLQFYFPTI